MDENEVLARMESLRSLFDFAELPADATTYQALVEIAEWLRKVRDFAVHEPVLSIDLPY